MKNLKVLSVLLVILILLSGCANQDNSTTSSSSKGLDSLVIGVMPDINSIPLVIAQEEGYFRKEGLKVEIMQFKSAIARDSALQSGNLDGEITDVLAIAFAHQNGFDLKITSRTTGSYKMIVNQDSKITSVADLKGKEVGLSKNTLIEYVTDKIIVKSGYQPEIVNKVAISQIPNRLAMLENGKIDAATLPDPLATLAIKQGGKLLHSSNQLGMHLGFIAFTGEAIQQKPEEIKALYRAYNKAIDYINRTPLEEYIDIVIDEVSFPQSIKDTIELPRYNKAQLPKSSDIDEVIDWLYNKELIDQKYQSSDLVVDRFVD